MKLAENMVRDERIFFWTHFCSAEKNLDFIFVSSSVMWSYNRNRFNELQIKKERINCGIWCYGEKKIDGLFGWQRQSSKMKGKKGIIDFIIIESDFMNREKPSNYIDICVHYDKMSMLIPLPAIVSVEKITWANFIFINHHIICRYQKAISSGVRKYLQEDLFYWSYSYIYIYRIHSICVQVLDSKQKLSRKCVCVRAQKWGRGGGGRKIVAYDVI